MRRAKLVGYGLVVLLATPAAVGCGPGTLWHMFGGTKEKVEPDQPLPPKGDKKEVTVAVLASSAPTLGYDFAGIDRDLAALVGKKLAEETKDAKVKFVAVEPAKVSKYLATHPNWRVAPTGRIAKDLGADYVIDLTVNAISMFQPTYGREVYAGRASVEGRVYDADQPDQPLREYNQESTGEPKDAASMTPAGYRQWFVNRLATELAWRHVPHKPQRELGPLK